jgi:hypothetical protein
VEALAKMDLSAVVLTKAEADRRRRMPFTDHWFSLHFLSFQTLPKMLLTTLTI